jgi:hypothetical protein
LFTQNSTENNAFKAGELLEYDVSYSSALGDFTAGKARVKIKEWDDMEGNTGFHFVGTGETNNFFDVFYEVVDRFESKVDGKTLLPFHFIRNTHEGSYIYNDTVFFDRNLDSVFSMRKKKRVPADVHDIVSAVFYMRTLSIEDFGEDSVYQLNFYLDDSVYNSAIKFEGKGIIETKWGWLPCLKVWPMLAIGEVFTNKYPMSVWITDDENHIPIMAESEIIVGSVKMELNNFKGLKNPFIEPLTKKELKAYK